MLRSHAYKNLRTLLSLGLCTVSGTVLANNPFPLGPIGGTATETEGTSLLRITAVDTGGPGGLAGLQIGDEIYSVNGEVLPKTGSQYGDVWKGAVTTLGYEIEKAQASGGSLTLGIMRQGVGAMTVNLTLPQAAAWKMSYPLGDARAEAYYEKMCADLHSRTTASSDGNFGYNSGTFGMILLAHPEWNSTTGAKPYRNSINKIKDRCVAHLNGAILEPVEASDPNYVGPGLENWDLTMSAMFLGEYRRKTGDTSVDADVQRATEMLANRIQYYAQTDDGGTVHNKLGLMGHGGVVGDYPHVGMSGLNIINSHTMVAMGVLKGAGADFSQQAGGSGLTIDQKFLMNWNWLKSTMNDSQGADDGNVGYGWKQGGYDSTARTSGAAMGYQIYLDAGGTAATADDIDKRDRMEAYCVRQWQKMQHAHAYTASGVSFNMMLMPFLDERSRRHFMENNRFLFTMSQDHHGEIDYFPGRGNNGGDSYIGYDNAKYYLGMAYASMSGNLPSFPAVSTERIYARLDSHDSSWPALDHREVKVTGLSHALDLTILDENGDPLASGYTATWSQVSGSAVTFSTTSAEDTTVTFPTVGTYRLQLDVTSGTKTTTEVYDFVVSGSAAPAGYAQGAADYEVYTGLSGTAVTDLTSAAKYPESPDVTGTLSNGLVATYSGDNYGQRVKGYIVPPVTGDYRFYIACDDGGELRLNSAGADPAGATAICSVSTWTDAGQWDKEAGQESSLISLTAGQVYYFEALHKEAVGGDHLQIGWKLPSSSTIDVVPAQVVAREDITAIATQPTSRVIAPGSTAVLDVGVVGEGPFYYEWKLDGVSYWGASGSPTLNVSNISKSLEGDYVCHIYHPDGVLVSNPATITVAATSTVTQGGLRREWWNSVSGSAVSNLTSDTRYPLMPDFTEFVSSFETASGSGDNYGAKFSGWIVPPTTGDYKFYMASDDASELWLSTDDAAANKVRIINKTGYNGYRSYSNGGQSAVISLVAGQRYYIEALHKEAGGGDHMSVAWQMPGGAVPANGSEPIGAEYLEGLVNQPDPTYNGLNAWWPMDEGSGSVTYDKLGSAADGVIQGAGWTTGVGQNALVFDGNDMVKCGNNASLSGATPFTASAWVKVDAGSTSQGVIIQQRAANGYNGQFQVTVGGNGTLGFYLYGNSAQQFSFSGATAINDGQWHHVVAKRDGQGNASIWLDGVMDGSVTGTTVRDLGSGIDIGIGADIRDNNKYFKGSIDEVRLYSRELSTAEILSLSQFGGNQTPVIYDATYSVSEDAVLGTSVGKPTVLEHNAGDTLTYAITAGNAGGQFAINSSTGEITTAAAFDYESTSQYVLTVEVSDGQYTDSASITVDVTDANEAPSVSGGGASLAENVAVGTAVATVSASDPDTGDSVTYAITAGNTGGAFAIDAAGAITTAAALNYEGTNSYALTVTATDTGGLTGSAVVNVTVTDVDESAAGGVSAWEEFIAGASTPAVSKMANGLAGNAVTTVDLSALSGDATYEFFVDAEDAGQGAVHLLNVAGFSSYRFEQWNNSGNLGVTRYGVSDYQLTAESGQSVASPYGALHHVVFVVDATNGVTKVYVDTVLVGTLNQVFTINSATTTLGDASMRSDATTGIHAFAAYNSVLADSEITDRYNTWQGNFPPVAVDSTFSVSENAAAGTSVGTVSATDPDTGDTLAYSITAGNGGGEFAINSSTGEITTTTALDYESATQYVLTVEVSDGTITDTATITVDVTNVNEAPVANGASGNVNEDAAVGTAVATVTSTDPDAGDSVTYAITAGNDGSFAIDSATGVITTAAGLDYETTSSYTLTVEVTDGGGLTDTASVGIAINDVANDDSDSDGLADEWEIANFGSVSATDGASDSDGDGLSNAEEMAIGGDPNSSDSDSDGFADVLEVTVGTDLADAQSTPDSTYSGLNSWWNLNEAVGATTALDNSGSGFHASVNDITFNGSEATFDGVDDGLNAGTAAAILGTGDYTVSAHVKTAAGFNSTGVVIQQRDPGSVGYQGEYMLNVNANGTVTYFIYNSGYQVNLTTTATVNDGNWHHIMAVRSGTTVTVYIDGVQAAQGTGTAKELLSRSVTIGYDHRDNNKYFNGSIDDVRVYNRAVNNQEFYPNSAPTASDDTFSVNENAAAGTSVGTVIATDPDAGDILAYAIVAGNAGGEFAIDAGTGAITTTAALDYETASQYVLTVEVTDSGLLTDTATITVNVNNVNEAPVANDASGSVAEDAAIGTAVATVTSSDVDAGDSVSYAITAGNDGSFAIDSATGAITTAAALDYEAANSYALTVTATDAGGLTDTA
ncbi:cadherin domain-containing protein, partial [Rubritalea halochordaticola]|uniref:cadherin domain-containing protein n=1 Tax=Rubritalea halochordaticola TaxID=714537 RepID=UPI0031FDE0C5